MSDDKANAPLNIVIGRTNGRGGDGFYADPLDTVADSTGIISPDVLKRYATKNGVSGIEKYIHDCFLRLPYREVLVAMGLNEHCIGINRIDTGVSYISYDVTRLYAHRIMDYAIIALDLIRENTGRQLHVILVLEDWTEQEVAQLKRHYPDVDTAEKFNDVPPVLYSLEHQPQESSQD